MNQLLARQLIAVISVALLAGCEDNKKPETKSGAQNPPNIEGFTIIRPKEIKQSNRWFSKTYEPEASDNRSLYPDRSSDVDSRISKLPLEVLNPVYMSDQLWGRSVPPGVAISYEFACDDQHSGENQSFIKRGRFNFDRPIRIAEMLPREALIRPYDKSGDSLRCRFQQLYAYWQNDPDMGRRVRHSLGLVPAFDLSEPELQFGIRLSDGNKELNWSQHADGALIDKQQMIENMKVYADDSLEQTARFNRLRLMCQTFDIDYEVGSTSDQAHLTGLDFKQAEMTRAYQNSSPEAFDRQTCRVLSFEDDELNGVSSYFVLSMEDRRPDVTFEHWGPEHYGSGFGANSEQHSDVPYAVIKVHNPHDTIIHVDFPDEAEETVLQFVTTAIQSSDTFVDGRGYRIVDQTQMIDGIPRPKFDYLSVQRSPIYTLASQITYHPRFGDPAQTLLVFQQRALIRGVSRKKHLDSRGAKVFQIQPGQTLHQFFYFDAGGCYFGGRRSTNGRRLPEIGANRTYGVIVVPPRAKVDYIATVPGLEPHMLPVASTIIPSWPGPRLVYSTDDNTGDWQTLYRPPESEIKTTEDADLFPLAEACPADSPLRK